MENNAISQPERLETDSSLRAERDKTDEQLGKQLSAVEQEADGIVELARERADGVLDAARDQADATRRGVAPPASARIASERATADEAVTAERAAADGDLEAERAAQKEAITLLLAIEREETDERLLTERARSDKAVASRDDFLAMVTHDVRGILGGIALSADLLIRLPKEGVAGERIHLEGQRLRRFTGRMNRLLGDLLDVVSMESGRVAVLPTRQDACRLVAETMETFQLAAIARKILMTSDMSSSPLFATFDHDRILQVLANLVGNALKFTEPGGSVSLRLAAIDGGIQFTVRDSGCGIAADQLETIFERFSQAAGSDRRGLGLGLYIARCIVDAHGGKTWAESEPGEGSALHFTLPLSAAA